MTLVKNLEQKRNQTVEIARSQTAAIRANLEAVTQKVERPLPKPMEKDLDLDALGERGESSSGLIIRGQVQSVHSSVMSLD